MSREPKELVNVRVLAEDLQFPEGPVACADGSVIVVEIDGGKATRIGPDGHKSLVAELGHGPNGAAIGPDGALYVCNNGGMRSPNRSPSIQRVELERGRVEILYTQVDGKPLLSPNDLVFDETGHFWFTDYAAGSICYASCDGSSITAKITGLAGPNGIGLSPDGRVLYWAQTHTRQVMRRRLSGHGQVIPSPGYDVGVIVFGGRGTRVDPDALVVGLPGAQELDSLAIDSSGAICVGTLVESGITVISPDGRSVQRWTLPPCLAERVVTNICFGGPGLQTAYITCSETGRLVACDWPRPGLRLAFQ